MEKVIRQTGFVQLGCGALRMKRLSVLKLNLYLSNDSTF